LDLLRSPVPEEVRTLALRSSEAAESTRTIIHTSSQRASSANSICNNLDDRLVHILETTEETASPLNVVTQASADQSPNVDQIASSLGEIESATSQAAASSEEPAENAIETTSLVERSHRMLRESKVSKA